MCETTAKLISSRYGDARVVATKPRLDNSLKWDRKNILHYVRNFENSKPAIEKLLKDVEAKGSEDSGLRVNHLLCLVELMFETEKVNLWSWWPRETRFALRGLGYA